MIALNMVRPYIGWEEQVFYPWACLRWVWFPLTLTILLLAIRQRNYSILVLVTLVFAAVCVLQQTDVANHATECHGTE